MNFLKKSGATISINLDRPSGPYYPGDVIHAVITLESENDLQARQLHAGLLAWEMYMTEDSDGNREQRSTMNDFVAEDVLMEETDMPAGFHQTYQLDLQIPADAFPPYASRLIQSGWLVKATLDLPGRKDVNEQVVLPLIVPPPGRNAQAGEYGQSNKPDKADIAICLPRLELLEGETIDCKLIVRPHEELKIGEVRIRLIRQEKVHVSRAKVSRTDWIDKVKLSGKIRFHSDQIEEFPFSLTIPKMGCPTRNTENTTVTYTLQAALSRGIRKDYTASTDVYIYSGPGSS